MLVTNVDAGTTTIDAIDCRGRVAVLTRSGPRVEGGLAVASATFGRFAGDLIRLTSCRATCMHLPTGTQRCSQDRAYLTGRTLASRARGFVPAYFKDALVADRRTPGNRHPGDDFILGLSRATLAAAGLRTGDLLVVAEGGALTVRVTCDVSCGVSRVATGPATAHIEGHVVFSSTS